MSTPAGSVLPDVPSRRQRLHGGEQALLRLRSRARLLAWLEDPGLADQVASVDAIRHEITGGTGQLVGWAQALRAEFWWQDSAETVAAMTRLVHWATDPARPHTQAAVNEFLASGDLRLIAHALVAGATVVTREQSAPDSKKDIKIPDVCAAFEVVCVDPFTAYRAMGLRLVT